MSGGGARNVAHPLPAGLAVIRRLLAGIGRVELALAIVALVVVVVLSTAQAFLRYTLGTSLWWAQEVAETMIMVSYFFGISYVFKTRQEIYIEFLTSMAPLKLQLVFFLVEQALTLLFALALLWLTYLFSPTLFNMTTPVLKLPAFVGTAPLILATLMMVMTSLYYLAFGLWAFGRSGSGGLLAGVEERGLILRPWAQET
jgi:TRAP-type C4-dicarboxylate transport system permease small subunit